MMTKLSIASLLLLSTMAVVSCKRAETAHTNPSNNQNAPVINSLPRTSIPMPPLNGTSIKQMGWSLTDGRRSTFGEYSGKILVLDFYATWCMPCRESVPHLIELQRRYANDVRVVGLNVGGTDDVSRVSDFAKELNITYPLGLPDNDLVSLLITGPDQIPQTFIFDRQGKLEKRLVGFDQDTANEINVTVEKLLGPHTD